MVAAEAAEADQAAEEAEADQAAAAAEAEDPADPADPADAPVGGSCAGAKSVPSALRKLPTSTTKRSTRFDGSSQNEPRSSLADAPVSAQNTNAPFGPQFSGPGRSPWCLSWPTTPTRVVFAAKRIRSITDPRIS